MCEILSFKTCSCQDKIIAASLFADSAIGSLLSECSLHSMKHKR